MKTILVTRQQDGRLVKMKKNLAALFPGGAITARTVEEGSKSPDGMP